MRIQVVSVDHGTPEYTELMVRSLLAQHPGRVGSGELDVLVLRSGPPIDGLERSGLAQAYGVRIRPSGYGLEVGVTTHGEILRDAVLAEPECAAYLFVDSDVCFVEPDTIGTMARELVADPALFAVQARWSDEEGREYDPAAALDTTALARVRERVRAPGAREFGEAYEFDTGYGDRVHPFCVLVRADAVFRTTVATLGLSPAQVQSVRGARFYDTLGLATQVMKTHGRTWRTSTARVVHFGSVSFDPTWQAEKAARRDALLARFRDDSGLARFPDEPGMH